ncbi:Phox homologous domain [Phytophthora cactorum]|nr:Phox homologous domain [Phytophthora cactorum]
MGDTSLSLLNLPHSNYDFQHVYELTSPASSSYHRCGPPGTPVKSPITSPTSFRPPTIAYLDQFELSVTASKVMLNHGKDVRYDLIVTPTSDSSQQWTVSRSFKELQEFQHKLLEVMQLGHLCHADCPYLYSSIKDRFPKECYLCSSSSYVMGKRRQALEECFTSLLEALRKRENHSSCSILPGTVAKEFITFLNEDLPIDHEFRWENFVSFSKTPSSSSTWYSTDGSSRSITTPTGLSRCWQSSSDNSIESFRSAGSNNSMLDMCGLCTSDDAAKGASPIAFAILESCCTGTASAFCSDVLKSNLEEARGAVFQKIRGVAASSRHSKMRVTFPAELYIAGIPRWWW